MENLKAILAAAGGSLDDVLRCEVFVADLREMGIFNRVWQEYFGDQPPARISAQVAGVAAGARLELTAVAYVGTRS
ncbi:MAG TPA: RidA family protein [Bacillota bacterium]